MNDRDFLIIHDLRSLMLMQNASGVSDSPCRCKNIKGVLLENNRRYLCFRFYTEKIAAYPREGRSEILWANKISRERTNNKLSRLE